MAYIEARTSELELRKDEKNSELTTDDILDEIGHRSLQILKIFVLTSSGWAITAPLVMLGAFIDDSVCDYSKPQNLSIDCLEGKSGSLIDEFSLILENSYQKHWFTSIFMWGNILGGCVISFFSDQYGRRFVVVICLFLQGVACCLGLLVRSYFSLLVLRFLQGVFFTGSGVALWILGYESIPSVLRPYATFAFGTTWVVGYCLVAPLAYYVKEWRWLMFDVGFPCVIYGLILFFYLPESLHFLVTKNLQKDAYDWVTVAANEKLASRIDWNSLCGIRIKNFEERKNFEQFKNLILKKKLLIRTLIFAFLWTTDVLVYFGMSLFSVSLVGNKYINYIAIGLVEVPAVAFGPFLLDKIGRRLTISTTHLTTAFAFGFSAFFFTDSPKIQLFFWLLAKFAIAAAFMCIFAFSSESFPTPERNICIGICSVIGKLIGSSAPFIQTTAQIWEPLPLVLFGSISAAAGLVTLLLPETNHKQLPDTFDSMS